MVEIIEYKIECGPAPIEVFPDSTDDKIKPSDTEEIIGLDTYMPWEEMEYDFLLFASRRD